MRPALELPNHLQDIKLTLPRLSFGTPKHRRAASIGSSNLLPGGKGGGIPTKPSFSQLLPHPGPLSLDPMFQQVLTALQAYPSLPSELELNYRTSHSGLVRETIENVHDTSPKPVPPIVDMHSAIPYSRKRPQSLYNSSSNRSALERSIVQPTIAGRINGIAKVIALTFGSKPSILENRLITVFLSSIETESKEIYTVWDRILSAFEDATEKYTENRENWDESIARMTENLRESLKNAHFGEDWSAEMTELTRKVRLILGKMRGKQIGQAIEEIWTAGIYVSFLGILREQREKRGKTEEKGKIETVKLEPMECPAVLLFKLVGR